MADVETKVHTSERLTLLQRQIPPRGGEVRSKALVCLTLTMTERQNTVRATEVRKGNNVRVTEGMEKIAENAMRKKVATSYCDGEESCDG